MPMPSFYEIMDFAPHNREVFDELLEATLAKRVVPFVGSGMSAFCFPTWRAFLSELFARHLPGVRMPDSMLDAASQVVGEIGREGFLLDIANTYGGSPGFDWDSVFMLAAKEAIGCLPYIFPSLAVTGSHDCLLERVYRLLSLVRRDSSVQGNPDCAHIVLNAFGTLSDPEGMLLTREDCEKNFADHMPGIGGINGFDLLFLGCSLEGDPLEGLLQGFWDAGTASQSHNERHFAITGCEADKRQARHDELAARNIRAILYDCSDNKHAAVRTLLCHLQAGTYGKPDTAVPELDKMQFSDPLGMATRYIGLARQQLEKGEPDSNDTALGFLKKALDIQKRMLGKIHPDTAASCSLIASIHYNMGNTKKALLWHKRVIGICERSSGTDSILAANSYIGIGSICANQGNRLAAVQNCEKALSIFEKAPNLVNGQLAGLCEKIAGLFDEMFNRQKALEYYEKALAIYEKAPGTGSTAMAECYEKIAKVYESVFRHDTGQEWHMKALTVFGNALGFDHPTVGRVYANIGTDLVRMSNPEEAMGWFRMALDIYEKTADTDTLDAFDASYAAKSYLSLGIIYHNQKSDYRTALELHMKALAIYEKDPGPNSQETAKTYSAIAVAHLRKIDYDAALLWQQKAVASYGKALGPNHPILVDSYCLLADMYDFKTMHQLSLEWYIKALKAMRLSDYKSAQAVKNKAKDQYIFVNRQPGREPFETWLKRELEKP